MSDKQATEKERINAFWDEVAATAKRHGMELLVALVRTAEGPLLEHTSADFGEGLDALEVMGAAEVLAWRLRLGLLYGKQEARDTSPSSLKP